MFNAMSDDRFSSLCASALVVWSLFLGADMASGADDLTDPFQHGGLIVRDLNAYAEALADQPADDSQAQYGSVVLGQLFPADEIWTLQVMPRGLLYRSYVAGPRESRLGYAWLYDDRRGRWINEATIGARVGLLRLGTVGRSGMAQGWQLDVEAAAMPQLAEGNLDLVATDFRIGVPLTGRTDQWQWKLAYYHLSSHAGDEFLLTEATNFERINFSRNALVAGLGWFPCPSVRLYGEVGYGFLNDGGNRPWEFQFGAEYQPLPVRETWGVPFAAVNAHLREEVDFGGSLNILAGWSWASLTEGGTIRAGVQYYNGQAMQLEFLGRSEELIGLGLWIDF